MGKKKRAGEMTFEEMAEIADKGPAWFKYIQSLRPTPKSKTVKEVLDEIINGEYDTDQDWDPLDE